MDEALEHVQLHNTTEVVQALREYAIECSILKVFGSEALDYVVDETVQIHGGYGFSSEYAAERYYRDARVHRIFEGTNEINRLMISAALIKRLAATETSEPLESGDVLNNSRTVFASVARTAIQQYGASFCRNGEEQEVQFLLADIAIDIYALETAIHRSQKLISRGRNVEVCRDIAMTFQNEVRFRVANAASQAMVRLGFSGKLQNSLLEPLLKASSDDGIAARRRIAEHVLSAARYSL